jgi:hypothetical protein
MIIVVAVNVSRHWISVKTKMKKSVRDVEVEMVVVVEGISPIQIQLIHIPPPPPLEGILQISSLPLHTPSFYPSPKRSTRVLELHLEILRR